MTNRRSFVAGLLATGFSLKPTWADAGSPAYLSAGKRADGLYVLCGVTYDGEVAFELPLPARGHAAASHPVFSEAVIFARRPGIYARVLDCRTGQLKAELLAPPGRHFYGHGVFSADGNLLFTTENDFETARGVVAVWDARHGYSRIYEFSSGGVGPHDIKLMPDGETLVVANGGIETHPETGRTKLNLPTMRSNLSYVRFDGQISDQMMLGSEHQRNSIRHLAVSADGTVAFAMQWQGDLTDDLPLLGIHRQELGKTVFFEAASVRAMQGYLGSVAFDLDTQGIAATSPRSGILQVFDASGRVREVELTDVCGVVASQGVFAATTGTGIFRTVANGDIKHKIAWDNHLVAI